MKKEKTKITVADRRKYLIKDAISAREIALSLMKEYELDKAITFGLPEVDDRSHIWRIALINKSDKSRIGEIVIDAKTSLVDEKRSTKKEFLEQRLLKRDTSEQKIKTKRDTYIQSQMRNTIAQGDSEKLLSELSKNSVELIFTSPPYYNARPEYSEYVDYEDYLNKMRKIIRACERVLVEGRFFVLNISPILIRRENRSKASKRLAVPFDFHRLFIEEGFEFVDDIIWQKPEGAGWATGRGRRFSADRNPLQYKPVPVTEYVLVYRKKSDKLIDWFIRNHPSQKLVRESKIPDGYDVTNIWKISPSHSKDHPAIFPLKLAEKVINYYSFKGDVVMDPFAGLGTVGEASINTGRRFVLLDNDKGYVNIIRQRMEKLLANEAENIVCINCPPIKSVNKKLL
ncbi:site-specific DNA-methyltransferase [Candidatus Nomurabacteria bacterium CG1_02_43_90]|uniref:Methyltransferase n=1 Tax=Candidatus Nomurabacteria bacterium CG1_02_43_90 TaxID=1805281 RepID=A0A1J4V0Q1_9BACT|nr:MAG: site-specific DNA-methyltransferase [Candidatus Nomurabacteria bacterium CG1_02_43_90]PIR56651.1 MAG: site-specific DNA-methyltransferase [Parcubacteria group bacterium CG10_big_fil_rev_8_21_14_0_10_41_35]